MITNEYISVGMTFTKHFDQSFYIYSTPVYVCFVQCLRVVHGRLWFI